MQLNRFTDLSLRVLLFLAQQPPGAQSTTQALSGQLNVPYHHLNKVVQHLGRSGWLSTARGRGGGLRLAVAPGSLRVGTVVRASEPDAPLVDCLGAFCPLLAVCGLNAVFHQAQAAFYAELDRHTLAEVAGLATLNLQPGANA